MTTSPVVSITDELIAELESGVPHENCSIPGAVIGALLAERADLKRQLAAASVDAERWRDIVQSVVDEIPHRSAVRGNAPGHGHDVPGIWDSDNGPLAGKECAWCKTWHSALGAARNIANGD